MDIDFNPYESGLPSWRKMSHEERLGIIQRYGSIGTTMVLSNIPKKADDKKKIKEVIQLIIDYVNEGIYDGGRDRMEIEAANLALFVFLRMKNKEFELDDDDKRRFFSALIELLVSFPFYLFYPSWHWDPIAVLLSCGIDPKDIPTELVIKCWIGRNREEYGLRDFKSYQVEKVISDILDSASTLEMDISMYSEYWEPLYYDDPFDEIRYNWEGAVSVMMSYPTEKVYRELYHASWRIIDRNGIIMKSFDEIRKRE